MKKILSLLTSVVLAGAAAAGEWTDKFYDGLEAQGEIRHEPFGYNGVEPAIGLKHLSGAKIFGAEKPVTTALAGVVDWSVTAEVRGAGAAEATVAMEFFDAAKRSLGVQQGESVKPNGEWTAHSWKFTSPESAKSAALHVLSLNTGAVAFARVVATSAPGRATDTLQLFAYALPFAWNKDWNGGSYRFTSFAEAPLPMAFHFKGDRGKLKNPAIELDIPDELEIVDAFTTHAGSWRGEQPSATIIHERGGIAYRRLRYANLRVFGILNPTGYGWERKVAMVPAPKPGVNWSGKNYRLYWRLADDNHTGVENALELRFVDLPKGLRSPKNFYVHNWQADDRLYSNDQVFLAAAKAWEMSGATLFERRESGFARGRELMELLKGRAAKWYFPMGFADMWNVAFLRPNSKEFKALKAPMAVRTDGKPTTKLCPEYFNKDPDFNRYYRQLVTNSLRDKQVQDGDLVTFDFEPWDSGYFCVCERCRAAFAKKQKLPKMPEIADLRTLRDEWAAFRCDQTEESVAKICNTVREYNPKLVLADYDYVQIYGTPDRMGEKAFYRGCAKSSKQNEKWFDYHICSYYHTLDHHSFMAISNNTTFLEKPYLPLGAIGGYGGYLRAGEVRTPNQIRLLALAAFVHGCPGVGFYDGIHWDGEHYLALMQARDTMAALEDFAWGRMKGSVRVECANAQLASTSAVQNGCEAVALFNYDRKRAVKAKVMAPAGGNWMVTDLVQGEKLADSVRGDTAVEIEVRPEDVRFLVFRRN